MWIAFLGAGEFDPLGFLAANEQKIDRCNSRDDLICVDTGTQMCVMQLLGRRRCAVGQIYYDTRLIH